MKDRIGIQKIEKAETCSEKQGAFLLNVFKNNHCEEQSDIKGFLGFRGLKAKMDQQNSADAREEIVY